MDFHIIDIIIILLASVLVGTMIFRLMRLPLILVYLVVGAIVGPHGLSLIKNITAVENLAGFGVVFLMFTVGLEFSLPKLIALRRAVFLLGGLQVIISIMLTFVIAKLLGTTTPVALVAGGIVAMSSTAIVTKQLSEQLEIHSKHGLNALGILLFQDLAVIPLLIMLTSPSHQHLGFVLEWALVKGVIAILLILMLGRWVLQPLFRFIAATRIVELFTLLVLLVAIASAWLTNSLGMSFALGAFLAGIMLAETKYRHQIEVEIRPFRDILLGLFFIFIGMLINIDMWYSAWMWILLLLLAILVGKSVLITLLNRVLGDDLGTSLRCGIILAQGGEFGFALLAVAYKKQLLAPEYAQVLLGALIISISLAPIIIKHNRRIAIWILPRALVMSHENALKKLDEKTQQLKDHVILCGYGHVGQNIGHMLTQEKIPYFALDLDPGRIQTASLVGENISYGDATHPAILKAARLDRAQALVICFDDVRSASKILHNVRDTNTTIPIIVRCKDDIELAKLQALGATRIVTETHEESLMMTYHLLLALHFPHLIAAHFIQDIRQQHAEVLEEIFPDTIPKDLDEEEGMILAKQLRPIIIPAQAYAVNLRLEELKLNNFAVRIIALRRGQTQQDHPNMQMKICANDILIPTFPRSHLIISNYFRPDITHAP